MLATIVTLVKVGDCRDNRKHIEEHIVQTPQTTHNKILLEASKDLMGEFLLRNDSDPHHLFSLEELEFVFDQCKEIYPPIFKTRLQHSNTCVG